MIFPKKLARLLEIREQQGSIRTLTLPIKPSVSFVSNDYLSLSQEVPLLEKIAETYRKLLPQHRSAATGSRLLSGHHAFFEEVEDQLAQFFQGNKALIFNSGYAANTGVFSCIPQKGDTILYDELCHACIKDGIRLSLADRYAFKHQNLADLERLLQKVRDQEPLGHIYIAVESIYSMDGDTFDGKGLVHLAQKYGAYLIVDEAHSTGTMGKYGEGACVEQGIADDVWIRVHTFGKAFASHGACVIADEQVIQYLINFSRPFIYTTALPLHNLVSIYETCLYLKQYPNFVAELKANIQLFRSYLVEQRSCLVEQNTFLVEQSTWIESKSPIQGFLHPGIAQVRQKAIQLKNLGIDARAILSPTVKEGTERIRICLQRKHSQNDFEQLIQALSCA